MNIQRENIGRLFISPDQKHHIEQKDIVAIVDDIVSRYKKEPNPQDRTLVIIDGLNIRNIKDLITKSSKSPQIKLVEEGEGTWTLHEGAQDEKVKISIDDVSAALDRIRAAVVRELEKRIEIKKEDLKYAEKCFNPRARNVMTLEGEDLVYKEHIALVDYLAKSRFEALEKLQDIDHPNIFFTVVEGDLNYGKVLLKEGKIGNLENDLDEENQDFDHYLKVIRDCMQGARDLYYDYDLALQDICLENLGYDKETNRGVLFDFDGLFPRNREMGVRFSHDGYDSPHPGGVAPILEYEMVHQFGTCLENLLEKFWWIEKNKGIELPEKTVEQLEALKRKMKKTSIKNQKPKLKDCIEELDNIISISKNPG